MVAKQQLKILLAREGRLVPLILFYLPMLKHMNLEHFNNRLCSEGQWSKRSNSSACLLQLVKHTSVGEDCCGQTEFILHERNIGPYLKILMKTCFPPKLKKSLLRTLTLIPFSEFAFILYLLYGLSTVYYMALLDNLVHIVEMFCIVFVIMFGWFCSLY